MNTRFKSDFKRLLVYKISFDTALLGKIKSSVFKFKINKTIFLLYNVRFPEGLFEYSSTVERVWVIYFNIV